MTFPIFMVCTLFDGLFLFYNIFIAEFAQYVLTVSKSPSLFASYFWWRDYYKEEFCDHKIVCHKKSYQEVFFFFNFKSSFIKYYYSRLIVICVLLFMKHNICLEFIRTSKTGGQVTKYANNFQKMKLKKQMKVCGNGNIHDS